MNLNRIKFVIRYLINNKWYSIANILGISVAFAAFILIMSFVQKETDYDTNHVNSERLFRLDEEWVKNGVEEDWSATNGYILPELVSTYPEAEGGARMIKAIWSVIMGQGERKFPEKDFCFVDSTFFDVFSYDFIQGDPATALDGIHSVVITESTATKYFGSENPIGQEISYDNRDNFVVTGVIRDMPTQSHFHFDFIFPLSYLVKYLSDKDMGDNVFYSYLLLNDKEAASQLERKINDNIQKFDAYKKKLASGEEKCVVRLQNITDIHLKGTSKRQIEANGSSTLVNILAISAILLIIMAGINYANLATAMALKRKKEVGIKKAMGATRGHIFRDFMSESLIIGFISILLACVISGFLWYYLNQVFENTLIFKPWYFLILVISLLGAYLLLSFISGLYPAMLLSRNGVLEAVKNNSDVSGKNRINLRQVLIIIQYGASIVFIIGALTITAQMDFIQSKELGFDRSNIQVIPFDGSEVRERENLAVIKDQLLQINGVEKVALTSVVPGLRYPYHLVRFPDQMNKGSYPASEEDGSLWMKVMFGDIDMVELYDLQIVEGRGFSRDYSTDETEGFIINEAAAELLQLEDPIGEPIEYTQYEKYQRSGKIVGVVKDFHYASLHEKVEPVVIHVLDWYRNYLSVKMSNNANKEAVAQETEAILQKTFPGFHFSTFSLDEMYGDQYKTEASISKLMATFALISVIISSIGLFGVSVFFLSKKRKEISIRRILGASRKSITWHMMKEFLLLIAIADILVILPMVYLTRSWLENFEYRMPFRVDIYVIAIALTFLVAMLIMFRNIRASLKYNPTTHIR